MLGTAFEGKAISGRSNGLTRAAGTQVASLTDRANDLVRRTERFLSEVCRVGGPAVVHVESMDETAEGPNGEPGPEWSTYLCYRRHKSGHRIMVDHLFDHELHESKPWAECSRDVKLETIDSLPGLINELLVKVNEQVAGIRATVTTLESMLPPDDEPKKRRARDGRG